MFVTTNGQTNLAGIALDPIVQAQTQSPSLRSLADKLRDDHIKALVQLHAAAGSADARVPSAPSTMQQFQARMLRNASTGAFEGMYLQTQALAHRMSIAATRTEITSGRSPALVAYARTYLPVAQTHLGMLIEAIVAAGGPTQGQQTVATQVTPPGRWSSAAVVSSGSIRARGKGTAGQHRTVADRVGDRGDHGAAGFRCAVAAPGPGQPLTTHIRSACSYPRIGPNAAAPRPVRPTATRGTDQMRPRGRSTEPG